MDLSLTAIVGTVITTAGGTSVMLSWALRGFWEKNLKPLVDQAVEDAQKKQNTADATQKRESEIKLVIDNQLRRDDGLIHKDFKIQIDSLRTTFQTQVAELRKDLEPDIEKLFKQLEGAQLGINELKISSTKIESMLSVILRGRYGDTSVPNDSNPNLKKL